MEEFISQKQIEKFFNEFVRKDRIRLTGRKNFKDFLNFLEIDIYDWIEENLRCYFRED